MTPPRPVTLDEIESLAIGAWILGTGGGGSPYPALLNLRKLYTAGTVVSLLDPADLADDDWVAVVSNMGAPLVGQERLTDPATIARAVTMMEEVTGRRFRAIMSLEIGGGNALQPFMAAALLGRPVVDADCMGRAFPEAQMTSFAIHDLPMYPLTLVDVRDNAMIVARAESWKWMERLSRTACVAVGSIASTCKAPRTGREVKACGILHSTTKAMRIGHTVRAARRAHGDPIAAVVEAEGGVDRMKTDAAPVPLIAVGGGGFLVPPRIAGIAKVVRVPHEAVANAVGAAIAQVSGEADQIFQNITRDDAIARARRLAEERAVSAGADPATLAVVEVEDLPIAYLPGNSLRTRVRVVGDLFSVPRAAD